MDNGLVIYHDALVVFSLLYLSERWWLFVLHARLCAGLNLGWHGMIGGDGVLVSAPGCEDTWPCGDHTKEAIKGTKEFI